MFNILFLHEDEDIVRFSDLPWCTFNIISSFSPFSVALDVSVEEAITIVDLAEFFLLLIDSSICTIRTFFGLNITIASI